MLTKKGRIVKIVKISPRGQGFGHTQQRSYRTPFNMTFMCCFCARMLKKHASIWVKLWSSVTVWSKLFDSFRLLDRDHSGGKIYQKWQKNWNLSKSSPKFHIFQLLSKSLSKLTSLFCISRTLLGSLSLDPSPSHYIKYATELCWVSFS